MTRYSYTSVPQVGKDKARQIMAARAEMLRLEREFAIAKESTAKVLRRLCSISLYASTAETDEAEMVADAELTRLMSRRLQVHKELTAARARFDAMTAEVLL